MCTQRKGYGRTQKATFYKGSQGKRSLTIPWSWTYSLQNRKKINSVAQAPHPWYFYGILYYCDSYISVTKYTFLIYLVFVHSSWRIAPKTLKISWMIKTMSVAFEKSPKDSTKLRIFLGRGNREPETRKLNKASLGSLQPAWARLYLPQPRTVESNG